MVKPPVITLLRKDGFAILYCIIAIAALLAFVSLAVDLGRIQLAKSELRTAVDSAARYAATGVSDNTAVAKAIASAAENTVDGSALVLTSSDIQVGYWNSSTDTFTTGASTPNAVRITARRSASNGNAVPVLFMRMLGRTGCDVSATATALITTSTSPGYGWVGLGWNNHTGSSNVIDSFDGSAGSYTVAGAGTSSITSNGNLNLNGTLTIRGNVNYGPSGAISTNPPTSITGSRVQMTTAVAYSNVSVGTVSSTNNNGSISGSGYGFDGINMNVNSGGVVNFPAGTFYVPNLNLSSGATLNYTASGTAKTIIYSSNFSFNGTQKQNNSTSNMSAKNFQLLMYSSGGVNINAQSDFYGDIYAPQSPLNISGRAIFGRAVCGGISNNGASFHEDRSLGAAYSTPTGGGGVSGGSSGSGTISTVK